MRDKVPSCAFKSLFGKIIHGLSITPTSSTERMFLTGSVTTV